jgi:hypothetical protein
VRGVAGWAEPVRSNPFGWTDRWAQAISPAFLIVLIQKKNPQETLILPKINLEKILKLN